MGSKVHTFVWTRDRRGAMKVILDGQALLETIDRRFVDPFDGFMIVNKGGDCAFRRIQIDGTG